VLVNGLGFRRLAQNRLVSACGPRRPIVVASKAFKPPPKGHGDHDTAKIDPHAWSVDRQR